MTIRTQALPLHNPLLLCSMSTFIIISTTAYVCRHPPDKNLTPTSMLPILTTTHLSFSSSTGIRKYCQKMLSATCPFYGYQSHSLPPTMTTETSITLRSIKDPQAFNIPTFTMRTSSFRHERTKFLDGEHNLIKFLCI